MNQIRDEIELTSSEYEKDKLSERAAKMSNGVAVIKVSVQRVFSPYSKNRFSLLLLV